MQISTKRFGILTGFAIMMVLLLVNALVIRKQIATQLSNQGWVAHTRQVQFELLKTESLLQDAEIGQRGYLYTNNLKYLAPYEAAKSDVTEHLDSLQRLTLDNPRQQMRIVSLRDLTRKKLDELATTVTMARAGRDEAAKELVLSDAGLFLMDDIRHVVAQMQSEEDGLDAERYLAYKRSVSTTVLCVYLASAIAVLGLILLAY